MYKANSRPFPDQMILDVGDDIESLTGLWKEKNKLKMHAIVCEYPDPEDSLCKAADDIIRVSRLADNKTFNPEFVGDRPSGLGLFTQFNEATDLKHYLNTQNFSSITQQHLSNIAKIFESTQMKKSYEALLRVNSDRIKHLHRHDEDGDALCDTMTITLSGDGLIGQAGEKLGDDVPFSLPSKKLILFDATFLHGSPLRTEKWETSPRVNLLLEPDI